MPWEGLITPSAFSPSLSLGAEEIGQHGPRQGKSRWTRKWWSQGSSPSTTWQLTTVGSSSTSGDLMPPLVSTGVERT